MIYHSVKCRGRASTEIIPPEAQRGDMDIHTIMRRIWYYVGQTMNSLEDNKKQIKEHTRCQQNLK